MTRKTLPTLIRLAAAVLMAGASQAAPPGGGWVMSWSDEFDGTSINTANWTLGTGNRRDAVNTTSAVSVSGGAVTVKTYTQGGTHYTGWLGSNGKFENCFGYWEARIRYNSSPGMWSAFWLQPYGINNVGDPAGNGTEIDISEHRRQDSGGADMRNKSAINVHWDGYGADHKSVGSTVNNPGANTASLQGNYHTYGLLWEPGKYTFYIDGVEVWSTTAAISNVRQWIYLTSEVDNGAWAGAIPSGGYGDINTSTTNFSVDYVRFYQRDEQVINPAFTHRSGPWSSSGSASWNSTGGRSGGPGVRLNPTTTTASAYEQSVHGLLPNTEYRVLGWGNVGSRTWPDIRIGVKNFGGTETYQSLWSNGFTQAQVPFVTGSANNSARVYARVPTQWGDCYADDIEIRRDGQINNSGFEFGETYPWSVFGDSLVHDWDTFVRSGNHAFRFNASASSRGAEQTVYGLQPNTTYTLSAWVRTAGQPIRFGVKNHGAAETFSTFTGTGNTWQRATHTFTTAAGATSATIYAFIPAGSNVSAADLDDFTISTPLPSPWAAADVGTTGRNGESFSRASKIVIRGSGSNVFDAADSFHFVRQPIAGDFALTAKLDSFEADSDLAKAGVMLRASTAANSAHAMVHWLPQGQVEFIWRSADGGTASYVWAATTTPWPPRLRLQRAGSLVTASFSTNGSTWTQVGAPQSINLPASPLGGPAVCAHDSGNTAVATFSNISFSGDRDGDGILDDYETNTGTFVSASNTGTDPDDPDTDDDGFMDGVEVANGTDPFVPNTELVWQTGAAPGGTGTWNTTTANWRVGSTPSSWLAGKTALFGGTAGTVTVDGSATGIGGLVFNTGGYTIGGAGPLNLSDGGTITSTTGSATIACPLANTPEVILNGGGQVNLTANNSAFTGTLVVDGNTQLRGYNLGTLAAAGNELGASTATLEIHSGSQIRWFNLSGNATYPTRFRIAGGGIPAGNPGAINLDTSVARTVSLTGSIDLDANATIGTQNQASYAISGPVSGSNTLTFLQTAGTSTISGDINLGGLLKTGGGTLSISSVNAYAGLLEVNAGTLNFNPTATTTLTGLLGTSGTGVVTKTGTGTLVLASANAFGPVGGTFVFGGGTANVGAIRLSHPQGLGNHAKILLNSDQSGVSRLELSGGKTFPLHLDTVGRNTAAGNVALRNVDGANTLQGNVTITAIGGSCYIDANAGSSLTITGNVTTTVNNQANRDLRFTGAGDITLQGSIADSTTATPTRIFVTKEGTGTLRLTGTCTHQPGTLVNAGTLRIDGTFTHSPVTVAAAGTLTGNGTLPSASVSGKLALATGQDLAITGALTLNNATLEISGSATAAVHILATRASMTGSFASVTGVPMGYTLQTSYNGNSIALVRDADADYQIWANQHGLNPQTQGSAAQDPDGDGLANSVEFVLGLSPVSAVIPATALPAATRSGNQMIVSFTRVKVAATNGFTSVIESATSLSGPWTAASPAQISVIDLGSTERVTVTLPQAPGSVSGFARLRVIAP